MTVRYPGVGDPAGIVCNGDVVPLEALRYHYWAHKMAMLLGGIDAPVVCEIGGGLGGQAWAYLDGPGERATYVIFDIPVTLVMASYFLLKTFPKKRFLLFGEEDLDASTLESYDFILMPYFKIVDLPDRSVDLFFNSCSFSEMESGTVRTYLREIERCCTRWLLHVNHTVRLEWNDGGRVMHNLPADEVIPDQEIFELVEETLRPFYRLDDRRYLRRRCARHIVRLFRRKAGLSTSTPHVGDEASEVGMLR